MKTGELKGKKDSMNSFRENELSARREEDA